MVNGHFLLKIFSEVIPLSLHIFDELGASWVFVEELCGVILHILVDEGVFLWFGFILRA